MAQLLAAISEVRGGFIGVVAVWHSLWVNPPLHHVKPLVRYLNGYCYTLKLLASSPGVRDVPGRVFRRWGCVAQGLGEPAPTHFLSFVS